MSNASIQSLWNHKQKCGRQSLLTLEICDKRRKEKQPDCDEIIHFSSNDFKDGQPKSLETLIKLNDLVNT